MKRIVANVIWKIWGLSPRIGYFLTNLLGYNRVYYLYKWVMNNKTRHKKED